MQITIEQKAALLYTKFLMLVDMGMDVALAYDAVMGAGAFDKLAGEVHAAAQA